MLHRGAAHVEDAALGLDAEARRSVSHHADQDHLPRHRAAFPTARGGARDMHRSRDAAARGHRRCAGDAGLFQEFPRLLAMALLLPGSTGFAVILAHLRLSAFSDGAGCVLAALHDPPNHLHAHRNVTDALRRRHARRQRGRAGSPSVHSPSPILVIPTPTTPGRAASSALADSFAARACSSVMAMCRPMRALP